MRSKQVVYVDMDNVLADYKTAYLEAIAKYPDVKYPQSQYGFFLDLPTIENSIESVKEISKMGYDVWFASAPSYMNPMCLSEKNMWIRKHFGTEWTKKLILIHDKSLLKGDFLIDDDNQNGQPNFEGIHIHFGTVSPIMGDLRTWGKVVRLLSRRINNIVNDHSFFK
jgi:5'-nucleotidase